MSRSSCISHPASEELIIIRRWQIEYCTDANGKVDECAAAMISFLEYWHNNKLDTAERHRGANDVSEREGKGRPFREDTVQWHTIQELEKGLLIFKQSSIQKAIALLVEKGCVSVFRNPALKYDHTRHFQFYPKVLQDWLSNYGVSQHVLKTADGKTENSKRSAENSRTIPESSSETTTEKTTKKKVVDAVSSLSEDEKSTREFLDELSSHLGLSRKQRKEVERYIPDPGERYLREKEALTFSEPRVNVGRFFMSALRDDWQFPISTITAKPAKRSDPLQGELLPSPQELTEEQRAAHLAKLREAKQAVKDAGGNT